jgi:hypothetical protein
MSEQARDSNGKFASGAEAQTRNARRHPVAPHAGRLSVGTHVAGKAIGLGAGILASLANTAVKLGKGK